MSAALPLRLNSAVFPAILTEGAPSPGRWRTPTCGSPPPPAFPPPPQSPPVLGSRRPQGWRAHPSWAFRGQRRRDARVSHQGSKGSPADVPRQGRWRKLHSRRDWPSRGAIRQDPQRCEFTQERWRSRAARPREHRNPDTPDERTP